MTTPATSPTTKDWILIFILALIWGGSFLFGRILMLEWPPFTVVFLRVAMAAACLWIYLRFSRIRFPFDGYFVSALLVMGLLNNAIPFSLILIGQQEIGSGLASVVNAMTPIWTLIIANFATSDEHITPNKLFGILFGFVGVAVLIGGDLLQGLTASAWAQAAILGATISYGFAGVYGKRFRQHNPVVVATGQLTASTFLILPVMLMLEDPFAIKPPTTELLISLLGLSILCTAVAYILFFRILSSAGATNVSLVTFLVPVSAIILGAIWLGESLTIGNFIGMAMILAGLLLIDGRILRRNQ